MALIFVTLCVSLGNGLSSLRASKEREKVRKEVEKANARKPGKGTGMKGVTQVILGAKAFNLARQLRGMTSQLQD
eukprot:CAMPEP_0119528374 /NCGR_PEP_ID=MMETSP1344-20130328/42589_1 /TAXON_ID=236787 /ORGANISM="Florenciella parvula, Strain CCMP2471" /LENGTH=74 /DNA_ID=CAMNT_0007567759 /DNA_START=48 /DNA_END=269 /DNA_ORIENTATION=+